MKWSISAFRISCKASAWVIWCVLLDCWQAFYKWLWTFPLTRWLLTMIIMGIIFLFLAGLFLYCYLRRIDLFPTEHLEV